MGKTIGRNAPCPCRSGKKYKKCHGAVAAVWKSSEFQAKAWKIFDKRMVQEERRRKEFGHVRPLMHVHSFGKKLVGIGNTIYSMHPHATALDAFREHLRLTLGDEWWQRETTKHPLAQHRVARWQAHVDELMRDADKDDMGRCLVMPDAIMTAYMTLAYDLWIVRDNVRLQALVIDRLRRRNDFAGVRYELLVAATFVRANFAIEPEDETDNRTSHPEFVATHRETGFVVAVEAKARDRRLSDRSPARVGITDRLDDAARKAPKDKPYVVFAEVAMPHDDANRPSWTDEVSADVQHIVKKYGGWPGPFDMLIVTSIPNLLGTPGEPDRPWTFARWHPDETRIPTGAREALVTSLRQYGRIPEFESPIANAM